MRTIFILFKIKTLWQASYLHNNRNTQPIPNFQIPEPENDKDLNRKNAHFSCLPICIVYPGFLFFFRRELIGKNLHQKRLYDNVRCNLETWSFSCKKNTVNLQRHRRWNSVNTYKSSRTVFPPAQLIQFKYTEIITLSDVRDVLGDFLLRENLFQEQISVFSWAPKSSISSN